MRFVILFHEFPSDDARASHWDLMLETGAGLPTWALADSPLDEPVQPCERLADHRPRYLDYEGPVDSAGGTVVRWDTGEYEPLSVSESEWRVELRGDRVRGMLLLTRDQDQRWSYSLVASSG